MSLPTFVKNVNYVLSWNFDYEKYEFSYKIVFNCSQVLIKIDQALNVTLLNNIISNAFLYLMQLDSTATSLHLSHLGFKKVAEALALKIFCMCVQHF